MALYKINVIYTNATQPQTVSFWPQTFHLKNKRSKHANKDISPIKIGKLKNGNWIFNSAKLSLKQQ